MTQTGLISSLALAETGVKTLCLTITTQPGQADFADIHSLSELWPFGKDPQTWDWTYLLILSSSFLLPLPNCCRQSFYCSSSPLSNSPPLNMNSYWGGNLNVCFIFTVFLHLYFSLFSCLQGDHRPEAKMHRLSHRDVRFGATGCWDHRSGSGGQVSKKDTALSSKHIAIL